VRGYTIEMAFLMPVILLVIMGSIFGIFYFHDKNILTGAAYETAVVGSTKAREGISETELEEMVLERVGDKCISLTGISVSVTADDKEIQVSGIGTGKEMTVKVFKSMPVTEPEKIIRDIRRIKGLTDGTDNNN